MIPSARGMKCAVSDAGLSIPPAASRSRASGPPPRGGVPLAVRSPPVPGGAVELTLETITPEDASPQYGWAIWGGPTIADRRATRAIASHHAALVRKLGVGGAARHYVSMLRGS